MRNINKHCLIFDKTFPYFLNHIENGNTLSKTLIDKIPFDHGNFFTFLPDDAELDRLYEFTFGGIIPPISYGDIVHIESQPDGFQPQQVLTMDHECSEFIINFIKKNLNGHAIIENLMFEPEDSLAKFNNVKLISFKNEVYYMLEKDNSLKEIFSTIRRSNFSWHFVSILIIFDSIIQNTFTIQDFYKICDNCKFIIVGAYDGEGYIIWERN